MPRGLAADQEAALLLAHRGDAGPEPVSSGARRSRRIAGGWAGALPSPARRGTARHGAAGQEGGCGGGGGGEAGRGLVLGKAAQAAGAAVPPLPLYSTQCHPVAS